MFILMLAAAALVIAVLQVRQANARARAREERRALRTEQDEAWRRMIDRNRRGPADAGRSHGGPAAR